MILKFYFFLRIKEKLENYPRIIPRSFVKLNNCQVLDNKIRIMQWNTLARALFSQSDPKMSYSSSVVTECFDWDNFRKWRILEEILRFDNDIICLEEVDSYEEFKPFLHSLGYFFF
jgi:mRNA deadenylase 3'-5' endonuclease subunit Ccr4